MSGHSAEKDAGRWQHYRTCETCGARPGKPCTVGQYHSPSPHRSTRSAALPHARRACVTPPSEGRA